MQRLVGSSSSRASEEYRINIKQHKNSYSGRTEDVHGGLPIRNNPFAFSRGGGKRGIFGIGASEKWIHVIPVLVLSSLFILWFYSYPVHLVIKDGRITEIHPIKLPQALNQTHLHLASVLPPDRRAEVEAHPESITPNE